MNLEAVSDKHLQEMERLAGELLLVMRQAKLQGEPLAEYLNALKLETGEARRKRFDTADREYNGY